MALEPEVQATLTEVLDQLIGLGRARGFVAEHELIDRLPDAEDDPSLLDALVYRLERADIRVHRGEDPFADQAEDIGFADAAGFREAAGDSDEALDLLVGRRRPSFDEVESDDTISLYFREVGGIPLLSREEEVALAMRIERGREAGERLDAGSDEDAGAPRERCREDERAWMDGQMAWDHLVKANSRLVISMAKRYRGQGVPFLDLIQEGNVGLMRAADKFDHRRGFKFSTYATWWIRQAITRAVANQGRTIRVPVHMSDRIRKLYAIAQALEQDLGQRPSPAEIATHMGVPEAKVRQMLRVARHSVSLEKPAGDDQDAELGDFIEDERAPDPLEETAFQLLRSDLDEILQCLTAREARILRLRYGLDSGRTHTLKEVGRKFNLTRERIRQIEQEALAKLRQPHRRARLLNYLR